MIVQLSKKLVNHPYFNSFIVGIILLNAVIIGLATSQRLESQYGSLFELVNHGVLVIFIIEAILKMIALAPRVFDYFKDNWNVFDFSIIVVAFIPAGGSFATVARLARLLRVIRLASRLQRLRLIITALFHSIPSVLNIVLLLSVIFYIYGVAGYHLFHQGDPTHWGSLWLSLLSLFRIITLDDWSDIMYVAMEGSPWSWIFFVSFVVLGAFTVINMFIAVIMNGLHEAQQEFQRKETVTKQHLQKELSTIKKSLSVIEKKLK